MVRKVLINKSIRFPPLQHVQAHLEYQGEHIVGAHRVHHSQNRGGDGLDLVQQGQAQRKDHAGHDVVNEIPQNQEHDKQHQGDQDGDAVVRRDRFHIKVGNLVFGSHGHDDQGNDHNKNGNPNGEGGGTGGAVLRRAAGHLHGHDQPPKAQQEPYDPQKCIGVKNGIHFLRFHSRFHPFLNT